MQFFEKLKDRIGGRAGYSRRNHSASNSPTSSRPVTRVKMYSDQVKYDEEVLPSINQRLGWLRPSRELLEYYRKKVAEFDEEHMEMAAKLEEYQVTTEDQHKIQWELRQREEEIVELQKALSDTQAYLLEERERMLRVYAENDRLQIQCLGDKKKIQQLLDLTGSLDRDITYFLKEPPAKAIVNQRKPVQRHGNNETFPISPGKRPAEPTSSTARKGGITGSFHIGRQGGSKTPVPEESYKHDNELLSLQVEALQSQLEAQTKHAKNQLEELTADRRIKEEEFETRRQRDEDKIKTLTEKLQKTQDLLYTSTKDFLNLRYEGRCQEKKWMEEKDALLQELDSCKDKMRSLNLNQDVILNVTSTGCDRSHAHSDEIQSLEYELDQANKLAEMYREQVIELEDEVSRKREEGDVTRELFKDRSDKISKRLTLVNTRYQELEKRRNLEVEGYKTDIKNLRSRLKDVERQLYKVTLSFGEDIDLKRPEDIDLKILSNVRRTAKRSHHMMGDLKNLKSKVYSLENDLRHL